MRRLVWAALAALSGATLWGGAQVNAAISHDVASAWTMSTSPLQTTLNAVSCAGPTFCAAVGPLDSRPGVHSGLSTTIGGQWTADVDPGAGLTDPVLRGVSCASSTLCVAVGQDVSDASTSATLAEEWTGSEWSLLSVPDGSAPNSTLNSVSCPSTTFCIAVGSTFALGAAPQTLSEKWDGSAWTVIPDPPAVGGLLDLLTVSCTSASFCLSLGYAPGAGPLGLAPVELQWNGSSWSLPDISASPPPVGGGLSCATPTFCMAAADNTYSQWNGVTWSNVAVAATSEGDMAQGLSCTTPNFCVSVGSRDGHATGYINQTLVKVWDGSRWSYVPTPDPSTLGASALAAVSCSGLSCSAVGTSSDPDNGLQSGLIESSPISSGSGNTSGPISAPVVGMATTPDGLGYWLVGTDGSVYHYGDAPSYGSLRGVPLNQPIVGMAATPDGGGYWLVATDGGIFSFGDAHFYGSTGNLHLNKPVVGMAATPDGRGYWFVASDGGIFSFGDAYFHGSTGSLHLNQPVVGMAVDGITRGYWLVAADGGIFAFDAPFWGSTGSLHLNKPIVGMETDPAGSGYRFVASDGGVFSFNLPFSGSAGATPLNQPVVAMGSSGPLGYWLAARDGGIFTFGGALFEGSPA